MKKIILIYANCVNPIAKGDFAFAGNIAKDMAEEATKSGLEVVLSTSQSSMNRFESLYGKPIDGRVLVERQTIRVCAIELLDPVNTVITAFIEANRCNHLPASELKRILSPETKFLFVGAANQFTITSQADAFGQLHVYAHQQPDIYHYYDTQDVFMGSSGIGNDRLGLPAFKTIEQLPELNEAQKNTIPDEKYGFIYLTNNRYGNELELICQYIYLTQRSCYVLIGEVAGLKKELMDLLSKWHKEGRIKNATQRIDQHNGLDNIVMRNMVAKSDDTLVVSTGVMSTLEAMHDGKLTYYQTFESNAEFVASYLMAVKAICANNNLLTGAMPKLLIELSELLFAPKPLSSCQLDRVNDLLAISIVPNRLVEANQAIINKAKGRLAPHLLSFIGGPSKTKPHTQGSKVCQSLRKPGENEAPLYGKALRRAAAWGRLFEMKVLVKCLTKEELNERDKNTENYTALHWAVKKKQVDCARYLVQAGADINAMSGTGQTALDYAIQNAHQEMIEFLVLEGASIETLGSLEQQDERSCADFIMKCFRIRKERLKVTPSDATLQQAPAI